MIGAENRIRIKPPAGRKSVRDWIGLRVRSTRVLSNSYASFPVGTRFAVVDTRIGRGLLLQTDPCACCGVQARISMVGDDDVELD